MDHTVKQEWREDLTSLIFSLIGRDTARLPVGHLFCDLGPNHPVLLGTRHYFNSGSLAVGRADCPIRTAGHD